MDAKAGNSAAQGAQGGRSKKQSQADAKAGRRRHGLGRPIAQAEEVEVKDKINLVRLRYEGNVKDGHDDPTKVLVSKVHKAAQLQLSDDRLGVTGYKGFRTARCSHGAHEGALYCEVRISRMGTSGHCRLGWCTRKAELQAPVGYDTFGFAYRDVDGSKVANGLREPYGAPFREGDVVGMYIYLPKGGRTLEPQQNEYAKYKGRWMRIEDPEPNPVQLPGSVIAFSVNGVPQGVAFCDFNEGTYYPAVSLYTMPEQAEGASVSLNFGPNFLYPPPQPEGCPPPSAVCDLATPVAAGLEGAETAVGVPGLGDIGGGGSMLPRREVKTDVTEELAGGAGADEMDAIAMEVGGAAEEMRAP